MRTPNLKDILLVGCVLLGISLLVGCSDLGYYLHCAKGQMDLMSSSRPIKQVIADPQTAPEIRQKLETVQTMRNFAITELDLPDNASYCSYADIGRPFAVWNVVATQEFSLQPKQWCFPVAGCVSYKGYFDPVRAEKQANELKAENYDVDFHGVQAYSTLSWFDDPVLNTFIGSSDARLAGLLFHELAHQVVYLAGDSAFNEAFAMTVQIEGVRRWFRQHAKPRAWQRFLARQEQSERFQDYLRQIREQLSALYRSELSAVQMRRKKQQVISAALERYQQLKQSGQLGTGFDRWMARGLNNARLAGIATYRELVPGFQALLDQCGGNLKCFYADVRALSKLPEPERLARLKDAVQPGLTARNQADKIGAGQK